MDRETLSEATARRFVARIDRMKGEDMRTTITLLALLLALPTAAEEITVDKILAAHGFGASTESLSLIPISEPTSPY